MNNLNKLNKMEFATLLSVFISRLSISNMPELRKLFETNGIDNPEIVYNIVFALLSLNIFMIEREKERKNDSREMIDLYNEIISNTKQLMTEIGLSDPVEIFAAYVYLYRKGFLSYNGRFEYSDDSVDINLYQGIDVVRGKGVCRAIASMLTDIYCKFGYEADNLLVKYIFDETGNFDECVGTTSRIKLKEEAEDEIDSGFYYYLLSKLNTSDHLITNVSKDGYNYILDPTNDNFLYMNNKIINSYNTGDIMKCIPIEQWWYKKRGIYRINNSNKQIVKSMNMPNISFEEYKSTCKSTLKICKNNILLLKDFYNNNSKLYNDLYNASELKLHF